MADDDAEFENFVQKVGEVKSIIEGLASKDEHEAQAATIRADLYLQERTVGEISEHGSRVVNNKTVINKKAFQSMNEKSDDPNVMSPDAFMAAVSKDVEKRTADRNARKLRSDKHKKEGNDAFRKGDYVSALDQYTKAINELRDSCVLYTNRALTYMNLKLYKKALEDCEWALKVNESSLKAWLYKAKAHYYLEDHEECNDCLEKAAELNPDSKDVIEDYRKNFSNT